MSARASLLCRCGAIVALLMAAAGARAEAKDVGARIARVQALLADWQLDEAALVAERLERELPDVPPVQAVVGAVRFHQGDYQGAVRLLRRASEGGDTVPLLPLAESTLAETRGYVSKESAHFVVRVPPGKDELLQPIALEALEAAYDGIGGAFDYQPKRKVVVDILHDARGLASVSTLTVGEIETSGTIAICKFNRLMATSPKALARGYSWLDTLAHEFVHLVVSEKSHNNVPVWLHEGLAKFNETRWRGAPGLALEPASENLLAAALKKDKLITFEQMHPSMAKLPSQQDAALAFAEVFTVVEMLERTRDAPGKPRTATVLLDALKGGATLDAALTTSTGGDLAALQREWRGYLKTRAFHLVPGAEPRALTFVKDARKGGASVEEREDEAALDEAKGKAGRQFVRLGNLLRGKRRLRAATVEYQKAVEQVGLHSPALHNRLAGVYLELGDVEAAKKVLADTLGAFPTDPQTHVLLGRVALRAKDWPGARTHYQQAAWEAPFNPEIHVALHTVATETKDAALQARAQHALELLAGAARSSSSVPAMAKEGAPFGILEVRSRPWGRVLLDGVDTGITTPLLDYRVTPGAHRVRVQDPLTGREQGQGIEIREGETARLDLELLELSAEQRRALVVAEERLVRPALPAPARPAPAAAPPTRPPAPWEEPDEEPVLPPLLPLP
ncbi:MAG: tetratricopeptide repeat protein [Deltaproteobacteria bacterium]|nr:tetratricopeptide repeat protein [Deltaproteobacteria bacterium]